MFFLHIYKKFLCLKVSEEEVAQQFGRHSVGVMKKSYLNVEQKTNALDAYNFIREVYDTVPFDENEVYDPHMLQKRNLMKIKQLPQNSMKRKSLEELTQNLIHPPILSQLSDHQFPYQTQNSALQFPYQEQNSGLHLTQQKSSSDNHPPLEKHPVHENLPGLLTQKFKSLQNQKASTTICENQINNYDVMGFLYKQQMKFQEDEDIIFERREKRKQENQRRFQEMMIQNFKK